MDVDLSTNLNALLPLVEDQGWFFDTEPLVLAERAGQRQHRCHEVPVDWIDDTDSRVNITAAVQAGTKSWKAFFLGSFDASTSSRWTRHPPRCGSTSCPPGPSASTTPTRCSALAS